MMRSSSTIRICAGAMRFILYSPLGAGNLIKEPCHVAGRAQRHQLGSGDCAASSQDAGTRRACVKDTYRSLTDIDPAHGLILSNAAESAKGFLHAGPRSIAGMGAAAPYSLWAENPQ